MVPPRYRRDDRPMRIPLLVLAATLALALGAAPAQAAWTGDVAGTQATFSGDGSNDLLQVGVSGAYLKHSAAGPGFASALDWNSSPAITETIPLGAQLRVVIEGGGGDDLVRIGDDTLDANDTRFPFVFKGGDGTDSFIVDASKDTVGRTIDVSGDDLAASVGFNHTEAWFGSQSIENTVVLAGSGADTIHVHGTNPADPVALDGGGGDDTARVTGLAALDGEFSFTGSAGDDSLVVSDSTATGTSVTDIDDAGLHRGGGTARPGFGVEHASFTGGPGADSIAKAGGVSWAIDGGAGPDTIATRDAVADHVTCGDGADFAVSDPLDALGGDCERSDRTADSPAPGSPTPPAPDPPVVPAPGSADTKAPVVSVGGLSKKPVRVRSLLRGLRPKVSADEPAAFQVRLVGSVTLARAGLPIGTGARAVKLKPKRRLVGRARRFNVRVVVTAVDAAGNRSVVTRTVRVRR
jgi:hypothetical protein